MYMMNIDEPWMLEGYRVIADMFPLGMYDSKQSYIHWKTQV